MVKGKVNQNEGKVEGEEHGCNVTWMGPILDSIGFLEWVTIGLGWNVWLRFYVCGLLFNVLKLRCSSYPVDPAFRFLYISS